MSCELGACYLRETTTASPNDACAGASNCSTNPYCVVDSSGSCVDNKITKQFSSGVFPGIDGECPGNAGLFEYTKVGTPKELMRSLRMSFSVFAILMIAATCFPWLIVVGFDAKLPFLQKPMVYIVAAVVFAVTGGVLLLLASETIHDMFGISSVIKEHAAHPFDYMDEALLGEKAILAIVWSSWFLVSLILVLAAVLRKKWLLILSSFLILVSSTVSIVFGSMIAVFPDGGLICKFANDALTNFQAGAFDDPDHLSPEGRKVMDEFGQLTDGLNANVVSTAAISLAVTVLLTIGAVGGSVVAGRVAGSYFK